MKSSSSRTAGSRPRREGKTACTLPGSGCQGPPTFTRRPGTTITRFWYSTFEFAYALRTPNPLGMSSGEYVGNITYTMGPHQDFDFGDVVIPSDNQLTLNFSLDVLHTLQVEVPPGGNRIELALGAFIGGLRYGEGVLYTRNAGDRKIFWQGPSIGWDFGGPVNLGPARAARPAPPPVPRWWAAPAPVPARPAR